MAESENQTEQIGKQLAAHRQALIRDLHQALSDTLFASRSYVRPSDLKRIAEAEASVFLDSVQQPDSAAATSQGAQLCQDGLGDSTVLLMGRVLRQFCHTHLEDYLLLPALDIVDTYHGGFMQGFVRARETITLREQERMRSALQRTLNRYALQMEVAADIAAAATSTLDLNDLLHTSVELIRERFDFYYAGLFLVDEYGEWAILRAGSGQAGQEMLRRGHKLEVGGDSMIGWCVAHNQPRVALDVGTEAVRFDNPLLPETRSEMALPLASRGKVIGAMSIQSSQAAAFSEKDVAVLRIIANQLANAIENSRLFAEAQAYLEELQVAHRRYLREAWTESSPPPPAYLYEQNTDTFTPADGLWRPEMEQSMREGRRIVVTADDGLSSDAALVVPITLRGQVIGTIDLLDPNRPREWTDDDLALVEAVTAQAALAVENARMFQQAQERARRETLIREITGKIRGSNNLETILQTTVTEVARALGTSHGAIRLSTEQHLPGHRAENPQDGAPKREEVRGNAEGNLQGTPPASSPEDGNHDLLRRQSEQASPPAPDVAGKGGDDHE